MKKESRSYDSKKSSQQAQPTVSKSGCGCGCSNSSASEIEEIDEFTISK
ncbi:MAG: hypothetical protein Q4D80_02220 [Pseudomonadota bacterium]|nr:hypothetical protein [Pseudomonadota bacterium]